MVTSQVHPRVWSRAGFLLSRLLHDGQYPAMDHMQRPQACNMTFRVRSFLLVSQLHACVLASHKKLRAVQLTLSRVLRRGYSCFPAQCVGVSTHGGSLIASSPLLQIFDPVTSMCGMGLGNSHRADHAMAKPSHGPHAEATGLQYPSQS